MIEIFRPRWKVYRKSKRLTIPDRPWLIWTSFRRLMMKVRDNFSEYYNCLWKIISKLHCQIYLLVHDLCFWLCRNIRVSLERKLSFFRSKSIQKMIRCWIYQNYCWSLIWRVNPSGQLFTSGAVYKQLLVSYSSQFAL